MFVGKLKAAGQSVPLLEVISPALIQSDRDRCCHRLPEGPGRVL